MDERNQTLLIVGCCVLFYGVCTPSKGRVYQPSLLANQEEVQVIPGGNPPQ